MLYYHEYCRYTDYGTTLRKETKMRYQRQGHRIKVLAYRGYDRENRRSIMKMLGSLNAYTLEPSSGTMEKLSDAERKELAEYIATQRAKINDDCLGTEMALLTGRLQHLAEGLKAGKIKPDDAWRAEAFNALNTLRMALAPNVEPTAVAVPPTQEKTDGSLYLIALAIAAIAGYIAYLWL